MSPKQYDWSVTLAHEDKNPFGTYALNELLPAFSNDTVSISYQTLYELRDSIKPGESIVIWASTFNAQKEDVNVLMGKVYNGCNAFISANYFAGTLADSLGIATYDNLFKDKDLFIRDDTASLYFTNPQLDTSRRFPYRRDNIHNYFGRLDSVKSTVIARNEIGQPVSVRVSHGKGNLFLNCTPLIFTNIHLLSQQNHTFASGLLSYLPSAKIWRTEFYQLGRMEAATPLRFILSNESLRWGYYIAVGSLLLFMIVEIKRKQRIIPIIKPLANTTLEFIATIANLYYQRNDHKNIAEKKIVFFLEQIRSHYYLNTYNRNNQFVEILARKSGNLQEDVAALIHVIQSTQGKEHITLEELKDLNERIEKFWSKKKI